MSSKDSATENPIINADRLTKRFGELVAVNEISFEIPRGERLGFLGPNGAGKSTTIRMLYGMSPPSSGSLRVMGLDVHTDIRKIKCKLGVVSQETNLDTELTVLENLIIYAHYFGIRRNTASERAIELLRFMHLDERAKVMVDALSGGMKRRLMLARALLNRPELIILDEPTTGLDPQARHLIWDRLKELTKQNVTIVLTTHYMDEASQLCDRILIMDEGVIIAQGSPQELIDRHVSSEALEIRFEPTQRDEIIRLLAPLSDDYEASTDSIVLFSQSANQLLQQAKDAGINTEFAILRPTTLEDVFLKLTGRRLRD